MCRRFLAFDVFTIFKNKYFYRDMILTSFFIILKHLLCSIRWLVKLHMKHSQPASDSCADRSHMVILSGDKIHNLIKCFVSFFLKSLNYGVR